MAEGRRRTTAAGAAGDVGPVAKLKLEGLATGKGAMEWINNRVKDVVNGVQQSVCKWTQGLQPMSASSRVAPKPDDTACPVALTPGQQSEKEMAAWRRNNAWLDEQPVIQVSVPKGTLCQVNSKFKIGIPPDVVFDILCDPGNKRVFKNIEEVRYRKVLEDDGERQLVEVDQAACWRFLWFSGVLSVCVLVNQNRRTRSMNYRLAKQGFMKQFEGSWEVQPLHVDAQGSPAPESTADRVASVVLLQQVVQPALVPPPPFKSYVRGITTKTTEMLLLDLQAEGKRLRESGPDRGPGSDHLVAAQAVLREDAAPEDALKDTAKKPAGGRRKARKSRWRLKTESSP